MDPQKETENKHVFPNPLLNVYVLETLMSFLGLSDLKECRLVNSVWNIEAQKVLKTKSVIHLNSNDGISTSKNFREKGTWSTRTLKYLQEMQPNFVHESFKIVSFNFDDIKLHHESTLAMCSFIERIGHHIKYLDLKVSISTENDIKLFNTILMNVPNLVNFKLNLILLQNHMSFPLPNWWFTPQKPLVNVKCLELEMQEPTKRFTDSSRLVAERLIELLPNVESFTVKSFDSDVENFILGDGKALTNLQEFIQHSTHNHRPKTYTNLSNSVQNLTKLDLTTPGQADLQFLGPLQQVLLKHKQTLQDLKLNMTSWPIYTFGVQNSTPTLQLPIYPNLRKLSLVLNVKVNFKFTTEELNYNWQFPMLQELILDGKSICRSNNQISEILGQWLPINKKYTFPTVTVLKFPFLERRSKKSVNVEFLEFLVKICDLFPNAKSYKRDLEAAQLSWEALPKTGNSDKTV